MEPRGAARPKGWGLLRKAMPRQRSHGYHLSTESWIPSKHLGFPNSLVSLKHIGFQTSSYRELSLLPFRLVTRVDRSGALEVRITILPLPRGATRRKAMPRQRSHGCHSSTWGFRTVWCHASTSGFRTSLYRVLTLLPFRLVTRAVRSGALEVRVTTLPLAQGATRRRTPHRKRRLPGCKSVNRQQQSHRGCRSLERRSEQVGRLSVERGGLLGWGHRRQGTGGKPARTLAASPLEHQERGDPLSRAQPTRARWLTRVGSQTTWTGREPARTPGFRHARSHSCAGVHGSGVTDSMEWPQARSIPRNWGRAILGKSAAKYTEGPQARSNSTGSVYGRAFVRGVAK